MKHFFVVLALCLAPVSCLLASPDNSSIVAAAKSYVAQNSAGMQFSVTVDKVSGDYARAKATTAGGQTDAAWVFLKKTNGRWSGLTMGTDFSAEDYKQFGIPAALWIK
jgi:hypothetical protein